MAKDDLIGWGVLGCSQIAKRNFIPALKNSSNAKLICVASQHQGSARAKEYSQLFHCDAAKNYRDLLSRNDLQAVYISLPTGIQPQWCEAALHAGKHVLVEKTMSPTFTPIQKLISLAKEKHLRLLEGYMFQFHPQHLKVRDLLKEGVIGKIRFYEAQFGFPKLEPSDIRLQPELGGGALNDVGGYTIAGVRFLLQKEPKKVLGQLLRNHGGVDLSGSALLQFDDNITAHCQFGFYLSYRCEYKIWGTSGVIHVQRAFTTPKDLSPKITVETQEGVKALDLPPSNHFVNMIESFSHAILGATPAFPFEENAYHQGQVMESIRRSAREGSACEI